MLLLFKLLLVIVLPLSSGFPLLAAAFRPSERRKKASLLFTCPCVYEPQAFLKQTSQLTGVTLTRGDTLKKVKRAAMITRQVIILVKQKRSHRRADSHRREIRTQALKMSHNICVEFPDLFSVGELCQVETEGMTFIPAQFDLSLFSSESTVPSGCIHSPVCLSRCSLTYSGMCLASDAQFSDFLDGMGPAQFVGRQTLATTSMGESSNLSEKQDPALSKSNSFPVSLFYLQRKAKYDLMSVVRLTLSSTDQLGPFPRWQPGSVLGPTSVTPTAANPLQSCCPVQQHITEKRRTAVFYPLLLHHRARQHF